jgi:glycosyltransferase involved in cell wall biosynthesis
MKQKLISVNVTTYNRAHFLKRCLDSVLSQTYKNIEIIVVDDASSDETRKVVRSYQDRDTRIKYIRHDENKGNAYARNTALENCTGYYVAFMDDDDEWIDENKLKKQVKVFERSSNNLGIVCSSVILIDNFDNHQEKIIDKPGDIKSHILARNGIIYSPTVMTQRKIMEEVGGFDVKLSRGIDSDFYRQCIIRYGYDVYFMPEITTRIHEYGEDRMTPSITLKDNTQIIKANIYLIYKYFDQYLLYPKSLIERIKKILKPIILTLKN